MKTIYCGATLFFFVMLGRHLLHYGKTWAFSPRGIPVSVTSPDGKSYGNGDAIDPINQAIIRSGSEEAAMGCGIGTLGILIAWFVYECLRVERVRDARLKELRERLARLNAGNANERNLP